MINYNLKLKLILIIYTNLKLILITNNLNLKKVRKIFLLRIFVFYEYSNSWKCDTVKENVEKNSVTLCIYKLL